MKALLVQLNGSVMAVIADNIQLANMAKDALSLHHYESKKHSDDFKQQGIASYEDYMARPNINWSVAQFDVITTGNFKTLTDVMTGKTSPATHHPETFPHPGHHKLPNQTQLPRIQLPPSPPASTHSDRSHPEPGVAREHRRASLIETGAREEQAAQDQQ